jgi:SAM-dependent methyltransferase
VTGDYGGQRSNMEHESMVGTLRAQAEVLWPREREFLRRDASERASVIDICCGTGEILRRYAREFRPRFITGVDLFRGHLARAGGPVVQGDAYRLPFRDGSFDLALARHVMQAVERPVDFLREARRVLRPGGRIHVLAEDYSALFFDLDRDYAAMDHFREAAPAFRERGTDLYQGRRCFRHLHEAGFGEVRVEPLLVDNQTSDRRVFADIFRCWRDGYEETLARVTGRPLAEIRRRFDAMIEASLDPTRYTSWMLFVLSARA